MAEIEFPPISPRLETLQLAVIGGNSAALDAFWQEVSQQGAPLIEPMIGDDKHSLVTFLWRGTDEAQNIAVVSNLSGKMGASEAMIHMPGTDLWYKTYKLPADTRESYQLSVAGNHVTDPFNPLQFVFPDDAELGFTGWVSSVLELPNTPPPILDSNIQSYLGKSWLNLTPSVGNQTEIANFTGCRVSSQKARGCRCVFTWKPAYSKPPLRRTLAATRIFLLRRGLCEMCCTPKAMKSIIGSSAQAIIH